MTGTPERVDLRESTIATVHEAMTEGDLTAVELVERYRARIAAYDSELNAVLTLNDDAVERASELDARLNERGVVGPLHGVPVLLKDNHDTHDMPTTAGAVALADSRPDRDAHVVTRLRDAGAIVVGKANLQELSFGVDTISSLGGETRNAYSRVHRPSGSSGGTAAAVAANLTLVGTGSDTCSSVRSPPAFNACVGVRPTRGLVSRTGIVPLCSTQDTAGPIARTVEDAARLLEVMAGYDPADPVTARGANAVSEAGYCAHIGSNGLNGARIGVARQFFGPRTDAADDTTAATVTAVVDDAIAELATAGATIVDPVEVVDPGYLGSARVLSYEFARDLAAYLGELADPPHTSLESIYQTGTVAPSVAERIEESGVLEVGDPSSDAGYLRRLRRREELRETVLAAMVEADLDAIVYPPSRVPPVKMPAHQPFEELNCELAAHTGLPAITVPAGFTDDGLPVGMELLGRAFAESRLFELAAGAEATVDGRRPPEGFGPVAE